jgi:hypothetical protein
MSGVEVFALRRAPHTIPPLQHAVQTWYSKRGGLNRNPLDRRPFSNRDNAGNSIDWFRSSMRRTPTAR